MSTSLEPGRGAGDTSTSDGRRRARLAGVLLIASPVLWFLGVGPVRSQVGGFYDYYEDDPVRALNEIAGSGAAWLAQTLLFFAGTLAAVAGLVILASLLRGTAAEALGRAGAVGAFGVAVLNACVFVLRLMAPTGGVRTEDEIPSLLIPAHTGWLNFVTVVLTVITLLVFAVAVLRVGARVVGILVGGLAVLVLIALVGQGSLPPVIVYPIAAVLGVGLLVAAPFRTRSEARP